MAVDDLDIDLLLAPISDEAPSGTDVRTDFSPTSNYFRLRDARAEARAAERAADANPGEESNASEGWRNVRTLAVKILAEQAKDLEAAAWLTESLVRSDGLAGLAFGARLLGGLAERYWDQLYPMPDEDGMETRVSPVTGLNGDGGDGTLSQPLLKLPLFNDPNGVPVRLYEYEQSAELETIVDPKRLEARIDAGVVPYETMRSHARAVPGGHYAALRRALDDAQAAWTAMGVQFDKVADSYSPPTRKINETLAQIAVIVNRYGPPPPVAGAEAEAGAEDEGGAAAAGAETSGGGKPKRLATREDALASLAEIADYFRRTEPQSPLAYTIEDAIRRGRLSWPELIAELVDDERARAEILTKLGIKTGE